LEIVDLPLSGLKLIRPRVFPDERGYFLELMNTSRYEEAGIPGHFVQDNMSFSRARVLRGLHYQYPNWQGKLVTAIVGEIYDVVVDVRRDSPTFGKWFGHRLAEETHEQLWVPPGFAHGFCVLSNIAYVHYKCTTAYDARGEYTILPDDPDIGIEWPVRDPVISSKDKSGRRLKDATL
jgi:dTDP-4-dehydrorhamnose 3,5-epimerase